MWKHSATSIGYTFLVTDYRSKLSYKALTVCWSPQLATALLHCNASRASTVFLATVLLWHTDPCLLKALHDALRSHTTYQSSTQDKVKFAGFVYHLTSIWLQVSPISFPTRILSRHSIDTANILYQLRSWFYKLAQPLFSVRSCLHLTHSHFCLPHPHIYGLSLRQSLCCCCLLTTWKYVPLVDLLNPLFGQDDMACLLVEANLCLETAERTVAESVFIG